MQVFDASSILYAWDNYPIEQFPGVWEWLEEQVGEHTLVLPIVAFHEVQNLDADCGDWLSEHELELIEIDNTIVHDAVRIKGLLGIVNDNYHPNGVGENDLLIIACARARAWQLVSDEAKQPQPPLIRAKRKIPSVCAMPEVNVNCLSFLEFVRASGRVFR